MREEAGEACDATGWQYVLRELADLLYHATALVEAEGIALDDVEAELRGRQR